MTRRLLCGSLVLVIWGCGGKPTPPTVPVTGSVTYQGEPVAGAIVAFSPITPGAGSFTAFGTTDEQGRFALRTAIDGATDKDGAVEGAYIVTISKTSRSESPVIGSAKSPDEVRERLAANRENRSRPPTSRAGVSQNRSTGNAVRELENVIPLRYQNTTGSPLRRVVPGDSYDFVLTDE
ncbi:MAG: hypothetical protein SFV23_02900 [Planctomycetaceae bacterium]|nr:hypothetical protein [Planctomycetaceae bacterium]